jgi:Ca2+-binding EF-hand superfamily protein
VPRRITTIALAAAMLACVGIATAQDFPRTPAEYLQRLDSNGDGKIGEAEYVDYMSEGFRRMDANGDGVLDSSDMPRATHARRTTIEDFQRNLSSQFHKLDRNRDGYLNARELAQPPQP